MRALYRRLTDYLHRVEDHLTVRTQIAVATAAMAVMLVAALAAGAALISYSNTASLTKSSLAGIAATTSGRLDRFMAMRQQEIDLFSRLQPLQKVWENDPAALRHSLEQLQKTFTDFAWIGFARVDGTVVAATGGLLEGKSVSARPWFKEGLQRAAIGDVHEAMLLASLLGQRADGEPYRFVDIALPVRDANNKLLGVLAGHLDWHWASEVIADVESHDGNTDTKLSVIDKNGVVLLGPDQGKTRFIGTELAGILRSRQGAFEESVGSEKLLTAFYVGQGHREYQGLNWIVTASQPASVALGAAIRSAEMILGIGAAAALIGLTIALLVARRISRPILAITREADRIGRTSGPSMLPRQGGSVEVVHLNHALRSLLRRIGFAEERTKEAELRASENAQQLQDDILKLRQLAETDFLTGLMNRRAFLAVANDTLEFCSRYKRSMATLMIDIDHFKKINDTHGHAAGDDAIRRIAGIVGDCIRTTDKAARFGGEEFVVLLREIDQDTALLLAERIRRAVEQTPILHGETAISATVSVGVAIFDETDHDVQDMIERADQGLYTAKKTGRNRTFLMPAAESRSSRAA